VTVRVSETASPIVVMPWNLAPWDAIRSPLSNTGPDAVTLPVVSSIVRAAVPSDALTAPVSTVGTLSSVVTVTIPGRPIVNVLLSAEVSISKGVPSIWNVVPVVTIPDPVSPSIAKVAATPAIPDSSS